MRIALAALFASTLLAAFPDAACAKDARAQIPVRHAYAPGTRLVRDWCCGRPRFERCSQCWKRWEVTLELGRSRFPQPRGLVGVPANNPNQLDWGGLRYWRPGATRVGLRYRLNERDTLYLRAAVNGYARDRETVTGVVGFTNTPGGPVMVTPSNTATVKLEAASQTYELGWWRTVNACCPWRVEAGAALRVFHWHEPLVATGAMPFPAIGGIPEVRSLGHNLFFGLQPGVHAERILSRRWSVFTKGKAFFGGMVQELEVRDMNLLSPGVHTANQDRFTFAWGAEFELGFKFWLTYRWSFSASYNLLFVDGVVRGFDALDFSQAATGQVQSQFKESNLLLHFLYVGAGYKF